MANNKGQGRKPKPKYLKLLEGEPNKHRINQDEPQPYPKAPKAPTWLSREAKAEWKRVAPQMEAIGILTEIDMAMFASYCSAYGKLVWAEKMIKKARKGNEAAGGLIVKTPTGALQTSPYVWIYNKALEQIRSFGSEFGLSPSSRTRIKVVKPDEDEDDIFTK